MSGNGLPDPRRYADLSRETYELALEKISELEATRNRCEAAGNPFPRRLNHDLSYYRWKAAEIRLHGHRAHVKEVKESVGDTKLRDLKERVIAERAKYNRSPAPHSVVSGESGPSVGEKVRRLRRDRGLRQMDLATLSGLSKDTIRDLEASKTRPQNATLWAITEALEFAGVEDVREQIWGKKS